MLDRRGTWTRTNIANERERRRSADAERAVRVAHHVKYGDHGALEPTCGCWGCQRSVRIIPGIGSEQEGQE